MYGIYDIPLSLRESSFSLSIDTKDTGCKYLRETAGEQIEKSLLAKDCSILIYPVEPLHTPKDLTPYLLVEFVKKLIIEPKGNSRIYITFPAEIGIYAGRSGKNSKNFQVIDIFSLYPGKYSLYGDISNGILCKYYRSDIFMDYPKVNPFLEGVMELTISNKSERWAEVSRVVLNAYLMKIYFGKNKMGMKGLMSIIDKDIAETSFSDSPLEKGMKKAVEYYVSSGIIMKSSIFAMEWGYDSK